jgi:shikimate dehydrogenase
LTARVGLIGQPVQHSISPIFQQAAFDALTIDARYEAWETSAAALPERIATLRRDGFLGANVTVPHKETAAALIDQADELVRRTGALNTIYRRGSTLFATNTDVAGFRNALQAAGFAVAGKRAVVLGAGGAARAIVLALELDGARSVVVANRTAARAQTLVEALRSDTGPELTTEPWAEAISARRLANADLLIHCTTVGLAGSSAEHASPVGAGALHAGLFVADIVANPLTTPLLRAARSAGASTLGGLPMLVYQGAAAFALWTERSAPLDVMQRAAEAAMTARGG